MPEAVNVWKFLPRAENLARMWHRQVGGERRGIDLDECLSEVAALVADLARRYDSSKGTVVNLLALCVPRQLNHAFARQLRGEQEHLGMEEMPEGEVEPSQEQQFQLERVRAWAGHDRARLDLLAALDSGATLNGAQAKLLTTLRAEMGQQRNQRARLWSASRAARHLRMPERRMRTLCEEGTVPAVRDRGWLVSRRDVERYRERIVKDKLAAGATTREAGKAARITHKYAARRLRQLGEQRARGRRPVYDREELLSVLTDELRVPQVWKRGYPSLRAVAKWAGCHKRVVERMHSRLISGDICFPARTASINRSG